ncbi:hypothetical protein FOB58_002893 [Candida parapsilosis]|uniref:RF_PROK_I domain-containing protein n=2 Tax=Candida parapsilosis TaxID=5480 RepID=G8B7K3_CANPC|nr:uncharacterized protein CPAR2_104740 [Candida parapsilosis]KAF6048428.1 hypothetical protein FOB59_003470 [Candida parapsilosis]KAF6049616.1 hypothetical protein FOB58_002893 [Candida parapsilosis]KAF6057467.1 hypothetical protein FOB60_002022 [Candida parapsilosis]KAF6065814.1 hypothetical protein FOB61_001884 [Candida parapsilosis]KAI5902817.1 putative peptide chain release factor-like protein [Candida parapsilosis]
MLRYPTRLFTTARALNAIPKKNKLPPRPKWLIKEEEIEESFIKGGRGPGGQKINKTNSKVQLTHKPTGIVVTCQATRSQEQNRKKAREILALKLDDLYNPKTSRNAVLTERAQKVKQSKTKKSNRKYRTLDEAKEDEKAMRLQQEQTLIEELSIIDEDEEFDQFVKTAKVDLNGLKE